MTKNELRSIYLEKRKKLSADEVIKGSEQIFQRFTARFPVYGGQKIHIFLSISKFNEVNTLPFIKDLQQKNVRVFVPKMVKTEIIAVEISAGAAMSENSWGIVEPDSSEDAGIDDFDYIITPLLYCDPNGDRVGYGKGFYDRFFATLKPECTKVGVGFFEPVPESVIEDLTEDDVQLDYLITPAEILSFKMGF